MQKLLLLFFLPPLFSGCSDLVEDFTVDEVRLEAEYAVPLVDSRVNLPELLGEIDEQVTLTVDPDGLLRFNYTDTVPSVTGEALFTQLRNLTSILPLPITSRSRTIPLPLPNNVRLDVLSLKRGAFTYSLPNTYDIPVTVALTFPNLSRNGTPLRISGELPAYSGSGTPPTLTNVDAPLDLTGYDLDFGSGSITVNYAIDGPDGQALDPGANTVALLSNLDFSYLEGYFGVQAYAGVDDVLRIDFFENYLGGDISFVKPRIRVTVRNSFGVPSRAVIDELYITTVAGDTLAVEGRVVDEGFAFDYPKRPGEQEFTEYIIDETNSNVLDLIAAKPVALHYRISALINPDADPSVTGFLVDTSSYDATVNVELPLYGAADDFRIRDSFPINLGDRYGEITAATLRVTTDNEIPFDLSLTGTFFDESGTALADLTEGELRIIEASPVDADGNAADTMTTTNDIAFTGQQLDAIRRATTLILETTFATSAGGTQAVRVREDQALRVRIGARLNVQNQ